MKKSPLQFSLLKILFLKISWSLACLFTSNTVLAAGENLLVTKITWQSGSQRSDFDMLVVSPDGKICNYGGEGGLRDQSAWGCKHLKDDMGTANIKSSEAFSLDLDKMDNYATANNLLNRGGDSDYKIYISRYSGPNIPVVFSFGSPATCLTSNSFECSIGNWQFNIPNERIENKVYAVKYTPKTRAIKLETLSFSKVDSTEMLSRYKASANYYNQNKYSIDQEGALFKSNLSNVLGYDLSFTFGLKDITSSDSLRTVANLFYYSNLSRSYSALDNFLNGRGVNIIFDIETAIATCGVKRKLYGEIQQSILVGMVEGEIEVSQGDWGSDSYLSVGSDCKYAYGTLPVKWESDGKDVILYVNNIYSFDIKYETGKRISIPLYKAAGDLIAERKASDFYLTSRSPRIKLSEIRNRAF